MATLALFGRSITVEFKHIVSAATEVLRGAGTHESLISLFKFSTIIVQPAADFTPKYFTKGKISLALYNRNWKILYISEELLKMKFAYAVSVVVHEAVHFFRDLLGLWPAVDYDSIDGHREEVFAESFTAYALGIWLRSCNVDLQRSIKRARSSALRRARLGNRRFASLPQYEVRLFGDSPFV